MLKLLILSDIHMLSMAIERDPNFTLRKAFLQDIKDYHQSQGAINHILVSGDIAYKGAEEEYQKAYEFFKEVCNASGCSEEEIYVVPGNHDKDFNAPNAATRHLIHAGLAHENTDADARFNELLTKEFESLQVLYQPFKNYHDFAVKFDSFEPIMQKCLDEKEAYSHEKDKAFMKRKLAELSGYDVYLYGMNTALNSDWFDINNNKGHKMFLSSLAYNADCDKDGKINIAMMHHPLNHIVNGDEIQTEFDKKFHIQIFGHLHKSVSDNNNSIHILSGALQPPKEECGGGNWYFSVFNILELDVDHKDEVQDILKVKLLVEKYNDHNFEHGRNDSKEFEIKLVKNHINRWSTDTIIQDKEERSQLPDGITVRKVRFTFLQKRNPIQYIKYFNMYDPDKSLNDNCITFLKQMEAENRLGELWLEINK